MCTTPKADYAYRENQNTYVSQTLLPLHKYSSRITGAVEEEPHPLGRREVPT